MLWSSRPSLTLRRVRAARQFPRHDQEHLAVPFRTTVLGVEVTVTKIDLLSGSGIVAICSRGKHRQAIGILDLPLPTPPPAGAEWIDAYRRWAP